MKVDLKIAVVIVLSVILFNTGCLQQKAIVKETFLVQAQRDGVPASKTSDQILAVQPFSIAPAFGDMGIVLRVGDNQYESDFYNEYFVSPAEMIANQTRNWLSESGLFAQVCPPLSLVEPTDILEGNIGKMVLDRRDIAKPQAELEISFYLLEKQKRTSTILFQKTYTKVKTMKSLSAQDYVTAQSQCLREILEELERDLASTL